MKIRDELKWIVPLAVVCLLVFANSLGGEFVYDDTRQIFRNTLIQDNSLIWTALTSDVWAFKGDGSIVASNYWRPTFTAWHILNFRLFGLEPYGWHVTNVLLHSGVCVLGFALLRRWGFSAMVAFSIALIFAVHPVHVETVAWVAGVPDLLFALALLASLWFFQTYAEKRTSGTLALSVLFYGLALGSKEIGIVCLPIYYFILTLQKDDETEKGQKKQNKKKSADNNTPLLLIGGTAAVYFLVRWSILGAVSRPPEDAVGFVSAIFSIPEIFAFYIRQIFFPYWVSANYPIEAVSQVGLSNFIIPLVVSLAVIGAIFYLARHNVRARLAASLFLLPLVPAMNSTAFKPEQIVHDRYLYLPLFGVLMLVIPFAVQFVSERNIVAAAVILSVALSIQTFSYNKVWANELALWSATRAVDDSSFTAVQYGSALYEAERYDDAAKQFSDSIRNSPQPRSYLGRGRSLLKMKRYEEAEKDLKKVLAYPLDKLDIYAIYQAYEALGLVYNERGDLQAAAANFHEAREKLPIYTAALTANLAIVLYQGGQKDEALRELEGARSSARKELLPESKSVFFRLGMLYGELGRKDEARIALREYLTLTQNIKDEDTLAERSMAVKVLDGLK